MKAIIHQNRSEDKTPMWTSAVQTIRKGLASRASTTLTQFDVDRLCSDCADPESSSDVIVFTCGHHFLKENFESKILESFESRILNKMPISGSIILDRYKSGDLSAISCPQCVYASIRSLIGWGGQYIAVLFCFLSLFTNSIHFVRIMVFETCLVKVLSTIFNKYLYLLTVW